MKNECNIVIDLLPLYVEDMVSGETATYVAEHIKKCKKCQTELSKMKNGSSLDEIQNEQLGNTDASKPFKKVMKRMNRQFYTLSYSLIIFFVFLGFSWTGGENLMYNSIIMPLVGIFAYFIFGWKAIYKTPILLLIIDMLASIFKLVNIDFYSAFIWTAVYSLFVFVGIAIVFLLHYAFRKEKD